MIPRRIALILLSALLTVVVIGRAVLLAADVILESAVDDMQRHPPPRVFLPGDAPAHDVAVVLGASPGPLLAQRMDAACLLVEHGKVARLVLTGLAEEMPFMRERAAACLPPEQLLIDDGATRTLENLRRARDLFGVRQVLVVTQEFHMGRALYLADALGLDATGVLAPGAPKGVRGRWRERFARVRAVVDVRLLP